MSKVARDTRGEGTSTRSFWSQDVRQGNGTIEFGCLDRQISSKKRPFEFRFPNRNFSFWYQNGKSFDPVPRTTVNTDGTSTSTISGLVTTEEKAQKKNDVKARNMFLMALPNEHLLTFSQYKDAKTLFEAIQARFDGNDATKKTQKKLLKQMYENFNAPSTESLDSIFNRLQKIVSQLAILGENISQEDLNMKCLRRLPSEWNTHVVVWRNKAYLDTMSIDDLYNNFKIIEQEVKRIVTTSSNSGSQNMAFLLSPGSTNEVDTANIQVSTVSTPVSTVSTHDNTANLSDVTVYASLANQPNGSQLVHEDLEQIHEDDLEEMNLKWQLALLSMRARRATWLMMKLQPTWLLWLSQTQSRTGLGFASYNVVAPPPTGLFTPPTIDLSNFGLEEFQHPEFKGYGPNTSKSVCVDTSNEIKKAPNSPIIEAWVSDNDEDESDVMMVQKPVLKNVKKGSGQREVRPVWNDTIRINHQNFSNSKRNFSPTAVLTKSGIVPISTGRQSSSRAAAPVIAVRPINTVAPKPLANVAKPRQNALQKSHSLSRKPFYQQKTLKNRNLNNKINTAKVNSVNTTKGNRVTSVVEKKGINVVKSSACWVWRPKIKVQDHVSKNSGSYICKRFDYVDPEARLKSVMAWAPRETNSLVFDLQGDPQDALKDQGYFDRGAKGGKINGKGTIRTGKLDFKDVYFVKELQFNLFSVSQMCDKKNSVLFTDTEYFVLSPNFKLADESYVLLKVPRMNNMYSFDMKNIVPQKDLTCLLAKTTNDESMLSHRRLSHINFKNINKLVKDNLVRGLPSKHFEKDQTCVACLKGKQHKVSFKSKIQNSITQPLFMLHMDLFGPTSNRVLVVKPHFKTLYELFRGRTHALSFMRPFGCHVTILNTLDHLGNFDGKSDEGFFVGYSINSKAFRVYNTRTRKAITKETKNLKKTCQAPKGIPVGPKMAFKPNQEYRPVSKKLTANSNGNKKKGFDHTNKVSDSNPFEVLKSVNNDVEMGTNGGTSKLDNNGAIQVDPRSGMLKIVVLVLLLLWIKSLVIDAVVVEMHTKVFGAQISDSTTTVFILNEPSGLAQMATKGTLGRLLPHARGLGFKPRRRGFPSGAKKEWGLSPKGKVRVLHTAQLDVT
nr:putative ribonuclease H-like domain-containing protein [Tanacetum cinerariifolium]